MNEEFTAKQLADHIGGKLVGDPGRSVSGVASLEHAGEGDLVFLQEKGSEPALRATRARLAILPEGIPPNDGMTAILFPEPSLGFARAMDLLVPRRREFRGVSPQAHIGENVEFGDDVGIGPGAFVGDGSRIGKGTEIHPGATIARGVTVGEDSTIYSGAHVYPNTLIGDRVILHSGAVIGADGFGLVQDRPSAEVQSPTEPVYHRKVPQVARVVIEDDVEICANSAIDRAALHETRIGRGTKIDNLVQIAHNCSTGKHCILVAQTGIAGSTTLGDYVTTAGQVGIVGHLSIGSQVTIAAQSGVTKDVPAGETLIGSPARPTRTHLRAQVLTLQLPKLRDKILDQEKRLRALEKDGA
jgi:UDP-3-O-[3-hydroxymyristoyl] glucosamine N-acyltransferase